MKNTGRPAVSGAGAMGVIGDHFPDAGKMVSFPPDWPARRAVTAEERRRIEAAPRPSLELLALGASR
jgi:hypothetical protein